MENFIDIANWKSSIELFVMMLVAFLIGYGFGKRNTKTVSKKRPQEINDIETIFTEIRPEILKIIENHKKTTEDSYIENPKPVKEYALNFDRIGRAKEDENDDLTLITGVGPFVEEKLNNIGIYTYDQISRFTEDDIKTVTKLIEFFPGRMERDDWVGQAKNLR
ncbi:MAG: hypothetical protein CVU03_06580 [Bacteroidetes bacterium HGW-Bacteroidetes-2]|nr:MAG: hypothetical protein CVU03_06580 [Bacteroidetes bacterium HGW-Bacteroidetes-2]